VWVVQGPVNVNDEAFVCLKDDAGGYFWASLGMQRPSGMMQFNGIVGGTTIATSLTVLNQWEGVTGLASAFLEDGMTFTVDAVNGDYLTVPHDGHYDVDLGWDYAGSANNTYQAAYFVNNILRAGAIIRRLGAGGDVGSASDADLLNLVRGDTVRVKLRTITSVPATVNSSKVKLRLRRQVRNQ
jgi:hypothetical protein